MVQKQGLAKQDETPSFVSISCPWASIVKQEHAFFFDCFAGAGIYDDDEPGSPLISARILHDIQKKYNETGSEHVRFHIRNVEWNKINFQKLENSTQNYKQHMDIKNINMSFDKSLPTLLEELDSVGGDRHALFFIDPFGYLDATPERILQIMSRPRREVLVNLMSYAVVRASNIDEDQWKRGIANLLKKTEFDPGNVEQQVLDAYCEIFRNAGYYVSSVRIQSIDEPNIYFHLIHITRSWRGLKEMKSAMRRNVKVQKEEKEERSNQQMLSFIEEYDNRMSMNEYEKYLIETYRPHGEVNFLELIYTELQKSAFDYGEIKTALKSLKHQGTLVIHGSEDIMKQDIDAVVTFTDQLTLF